MVRKALKYERVNENRIRRYLGIGDYLFAPAAYLVAAGAGNVYFCEVNDSSTESSRMPVINDISELTKDYHTSNTQHKQRMLQSIIKNDCEAGLKTY